MIAGRARPISSTTIPMMTRTSTMVKARRRARRRPERGRDMATSFAAAREVMGGPHGTRCDGAPIRRRKRRPVKCGSIVAPRQAASKAEGTTARKKEDWGDLESLEGAAAGLWRGSLRRGVIVRAILGAAAFEQVREPDRQRRGQLRGPGIVDHSRLDQMAQIDNVPATVALKQETGEVFQVEDQAAQVFVLLPPFQPTRLQADGFSDRELGRVARVHRRVVEKEVDAGAGAISQAQSRE